MSTNSSRVMPILWLMLMAASVGCDRARDITNSERIRNVGMIGRCFRLAQDVILVHGDRPNWNRLEPEFKRSSYEPGGGGEGKILGSVDRGTRLRIDKVVLFNFGWIPTPAVASSDISVTFARMLDGPCSGELVQTDMTGLKAITYGSSSHVDQAFFQPCCDPTGDKASAGITGAERR